MSRNSEEFYNKQLFTNIWHTCCLLSPLLCASLTTSHRRYNHREWDTLVDSRNFLFPWSPGIACICWLPASFLHWQFVCQTVKAVFWKEVKTLALCYLFLSAFIFCLMNSCCTNVVHLFINQSIDRLFMGMFAAFGSLHRCEGARD